MRKDVIERIAKRLVLGAFVAAAVVCGGSKGPQTVGAIALNRPNEEVAGEAATSAALPLSAATIASNWNRRGAWRD